MSYKRVIRYYRKHVYGNELLYPADCKEEILMLTGNRTLTWRTIKALESMGVVFHEVFESTIRKEVADGLRSRD